MTEVLTRRAVFATSPNRPNERGPTSKSRTAAPLLSWWSFPMSLLSTPSLACFEVPKEECLCISISRRKGAAKRVKWFGLSKKCPEMVKRKWRETKQMLDLR